MGKKSGKHLIDALKEVLSCKNNNQLATELSVSAAQVAYWHNANLTKTIAKNVVRCFGRAVSKRASETLIKAMKLELGCGNNNQLARKLSVAPAQIAAWESNPLSKTVARNVMKRLEQRYVRGAFDTIFEFRKLAPHQVGKANSLRNRIDSKELCDALSKSQGIYAFYNSSGRLLYIGKTEKNHLLNEMGQRFTNRTASIRLTNDHGQFVRRSVPLREFAEYCSAYRLHQSVISNFEALMTRITPNEIINSQIPKYRN
ncbi:MAG: hypothetical protein U1E67_14210 [Hyphomicrobiales bacterium]